METNVDEKCKEKNYYATMKPMAQRHYYFRIKFTEILDYINANTNHTLHEKDCWQSVYSETIWTINVKYIALLV